MNEEQADIERLIADLLTRAGCLMEDISPQMISSLPTDRADVEKRIRALSDIAQDLGSFASAAAALLRWVQESLSSELFRMNIRLDFVGRWSVGVRARRC